jgi:hypothetical protein
MEWKTSLVFVTSLTALFAVLLKRALDRVDEQRRVASRLRAYLMHWQKRAIALNVWSLLHTGEEWYSKDQAALTASKDSGAVAKAMLANENEYQEAIAKDFEEHMFGTDGKVGSSDLNLRAQYDRLKAARKETIDHVFQLRKELIDGTSFVKDADVAALDPATTAKVVELRMTLASLIESAVWAIQLAEDLSGDQDERAKKLIADAVTAGIRIGYLIKYLTVRCEYYLQRGIIASLRAHLLR